MHQWQAVTGPAGGWGGMAKRRAVLEKVAREGFSGRVTLSRDASRVRA